MRRLLLLPLLALAFSACGEWDTQINDTQIVVGDDDGGYDYDHAVLACQKHGMVFATVETLNARGEDTDDSVGLVTCKAP